MSSSTKAPKTRLLSAPLRPLSLLSLSPKKESQEAADPPPQYPLCIRPPNSSFSTTKQLVVIPATVKRQDTDIRKRAQQSGAVILLGVLFGSILVCTIATILVAPLDKDNMPHSQSLVQSLNDWFSRGAVISPVEHLDPPTPTAALSTTEGYCGGSDLWGTCATAVTASDVMGTGQMQRPIIGAVITQVFAHPEYQMWCGCWRPHTGIDLAAPYGSPIMAADSGQVIWTGWDWSGLGWAVKINHGHYIATVYGHLQRFIVTVGQSVTKGQIIGYEGSTGASTGPHLHFMVLYNNIWVNPVNYVQLP